MKKILGYKKFTSKKGVPICIVDVSTDYSPRDKQHGAVGSKAEQLWVYDEVLQQKITPDSVGRELFAQYDISGNTAYLTGLDIK